jgi:rubrerythrin
MASLNGSKTRENLKHAFAGESQANRRYLYFALRADIEGYPDIGGLFRDTAGESHVGRFQKGQPRNLLSPARGV